MVSYFFTSASEGFFFVMFFCYSFSSSFLLQWGSDLVHAIGTYGGLESKEGDEVVGSSTTVNGVSGAVSGGAHDGGELVVVGKDDGELALVAGDAAGDMGDLVVEHREDH
eukprot:TRINITY_DN10270_c0_g1_i2.p2 TRINITY_DN10270_c0_g1~~TRINITY_DN10270_c0_g1_i2.p2  ORF type:complete len:110 (+),score=11.74 TRINITY_DN10270_c0_g1_i2:288-617(+)